MHFRLKREAACSRVADNPTPRHTGGYQIFLPVSLHRTGKVWGLRQRKAVVVNKTGVAVILLTVIGLHLLTMNVLYPKIVLFWAWIWGDGPNARHTVGGSHQDHLRLHRFTARIGSVVRQLKFQGNLSIKAFKGFGARLEAAVLGRD